MKTAGYSGRPLSEKLGVKPGFTVLPIGAPGNYRETLGPLPDGVRFVRSPTPPADLIHLFVSRRTELEQQLRRQRQSMGDSAMLWVSWPKQSSQVPTDVTEDVIREVALPLGLVDVKVCAVDDVWSGLKLMVRRENRRVPMKTPAVTRQKKRTR